MKPHILILTILSSCAATNLPDHREGSNLHVHSACSESCLSDIFALATNMMEIRRPLNGFHDMCSSYKSAPLCHTYREHRCLTRKQIMMDKMDTVELCKLREQELMRQQPCIDIVGPIVWKMCDSICAFSTELGNSSEYKNKIFDDDDIIFKGRNYKPEREFESDIGNLCESVSCFSACFAAQLNDHCSFAGTIIVDALLRPFSKAASRMDESVTPSITFPNWAPECRFLANSEQLTGLTQGIPRKLSLDDIVSMMLGTNDRLIKLAERQIALQNSCNSLADPNILNVQLRKEYKNVFHFFSIFAEGALEADKTTVLETLALDSSILSRLNEQLDKLLELKSSIGNFDASLCDQRPSLTLTHHSEEQPLPTVELSSDSPSLFTKKVSDSASQPAPKKYRPCPDHNKAVNNDDSDSPTRNVHFGEHIPSERGQPNTGIGSVSQRLRGMSNRRSSTSSSSTDSQESQSSRGNKITTNDGESGELILESDDASSHHSMNPEGQNESIPVPVRTRRDVSPILHSTVGVVTMEGSGKDDIDCVDEEQQFTDSTSSSRSDDSHLPTERELINPIIV